MTTQYERLTDNQWEVIKEYLPIKRKRQLDLREVFNAILWITRTGSQWRNLDSSFPKCTAVYYYLVHYLKNYLFGQKSIFQINLCRLKCLFLNDQRASKMTWFRNSYLK